MGATWREAARVMRAAAEGLMAQAVAMEEFAAEIEWEHRDELDLGASEAFSGVEPHPGGALEDAAAAVDAEPLVMVKVDDEAGPLGQFAGKCPQRENLPHLFEVMRERDGVLIEKCASCNTPRWVKVDSPFPRQWNYGPPPPPARARIMGPDEELGPGEEFERTDTDVPRIISTPQPEGKRVVGGRVLEYEG